MNVTLRFMAQIGRIRTLLEKFFEKYPIEKILSLDETLQNNSADHSHSARNEWIASRSTSMHFNGNQKVTLALHNALILAKRPKSYDLCPDQQKALGKF